MRTLHATIFALFALGASASAQMNNPNTSLPSQTTPSNQMGLPPMGRDPRASDAVTLPPEAMHRVEAIRADERQRKMVVDTDRLLALATELKADMDKTNKDTLSIQVIKKADEIEKLAHDIKQKMKN
jgi:hypothetical protein